MNYFKYLFTLVLSVGITSSAFAQVSPYDLQEIRSYSLERISRCITGVYSGHMRFSSYWLSADPIYPFEIRVVYRPASRTKPEKLIFRVASLEGGAFCTSYVSPDVEIIGKQYAYDFDYVISSLPNNQFSKGSFAQVLKLQGDVMFSSTCREVEFENDIGERALASKIEGRREPSFEEIERRCDSYWNKKRKSWFNF